MEEVHDLLAVEEVLARVLGGRDGGGEGAAADGGGPRRGAGAGALELVVVGAERERRRRRLQKHPRAGRRPARGGRGRRRCRRGGVVGGRHRRAVHGGGGAERGVGWGNFLGVARAPSTPGSDVKFWGIWIGVVTDGFLRRPELGLRYLWAVDWNGMAQPKTGNKKYSE